MKKILQFIVMAGVSAGFLICGVPPQGLADEGISEMERLKAEMRTMNDTIRQLQQTIAQMQGAMGKYEREGLAQPSVRAAQPTAEVEELRHELAVFKDTVDKFPKISGYYDFEWSNDDKEASPGEFKQHHLSLFLDKRIEKWHFFSEIEYEYAPEYEGTGGNVTGGGESKVETVWLEYNHNDLLNWRAGKILLPNYWTVNHYPSLTISTSRPLLVKRVFPFDTVGVSLYGTHYLESEWGGSYNLFLGNGEAANRSKDDDNENKVFGGKLTAHIPLFDRFNVATSTYIGENAGDNAEWMWGAETQINIRDFELLAEAAYNTAGGGNNGAEFGYYVQPGYQFLPKWTTFYRLDTRDDDTKIDDPDDATRHTVGLRYQPLPSISLKGEFFRDIPDNRTRERYNGMLSSVVIFF